MKHSETVLTEVAMGKVKCPYHNATESWKRFSTVCKDAMFDKFFGLTACYWHIIRHFMTKEQAEVLIPFYSLARAEMDEILSQSAMGLRDRLRGEFEWFFMPRNLARYSSLEEMAKDLPTIPAGLYSSDPKVRVLLARMYEGIANTKISRITPGEVRVTVRFSGAPVWLKQRNITMADFIEYLKVVSRNPSITRVWEFDKDKVVAGSRSGPSVTMGLSKIGSCVLV